MTYIERSIQKSLAKAAAQFPAVILTGPRQSGKTTLLRHMFGSSHRYLSLEAPDIRAAALADPRGFLDLYSPPVIFDEVQYVPELMTYIKELIDENRELCGQFILTGSQNLLLHEKISESLAGRAAILRLLPLSYHEQVGFPGAQFPWEEQKSAQLSPCSSKELWQLMLRGAYPELSLESKKDPLLWHGSYIQTYLERDVRSLRQVADLSLFQQFLKALAARSGQLFQLSDVARDLGIAVNTAKQWLTVLEACYQVLVLRPYHANLSKRLVKTPKVYFTDVGTLCYLCGLRTPEQVASSPMAGAIFETYVLSQIYKRLLNRGIEPSIYFWRTASGVEVDILVEEAGLLHPIEVKANATPRPKMAKGILSIQKDLPKLTSNGWVVHMGEQVLPLGPGIRAIPLSDL